MKKAGLHPSKYSAIHHWLRYHYGSANHCENKGCLGTSQYFNWAKKKDKEYEHKRENFIQLCGTCHHIYDCTKETRDKLRQLNANTHKTHCKRGHELTKQNTILSKRYVRGDLVGYCRNCRACQYARQKNTRLKRRINKVALLKSKN